MIPKIACWRKEEVIRSARGTGKMYCTVYASGHAGGGTWTAVLAYCIVWAEPHYLLEDVKDDSETGMPTWRAQTEGL